MSQSNNNEYKEENNIESQEYQNMNDYIFAQNLQKEINNNDNYILNFGEINLSKSLNDQLEKLSNNTKKIKLNQQINNTRINNTLCLINNKLNNSINDLMEDNYGYVHDNNEVITHNNIYVNNNCDIQDDDHILSEVIEKSIIEYNTSQNLNQSVIIDTNKNKYYDNDQDLLEVIEKIKKDIDMKSYYLPDNFKSLLFEDNFSKLTEQIHDYTSIELKLTILKRFRFKFKFIYNHYKDNTLIILPTFDEWLYTLKNNVCILSDYEFYCIENNKSLKLYINNIINQLNKKDIIIDGNIDSNYMDLFLEFQE